LGEEAATFVFSENLGQSLPSGVAGHHQQVAADIQNVTLEGTADHDVVGDSLANVIHGNAGDNKLYGGAGDDILYGGDGNDVLRGGAGSDELHGGAGADWLVGGAGDDHLIGGGGDDILEGGRDNDLLEGGAGDDRYLFKAGDGGLGTIIRDTEGANVVELHGFGSAELKGVVVGQDLVVVANYAPVFKFEDFVGNEQAFAGVQIGEQFIASDDLLA
jgi:Ca2+-binding RTX toxin-like protein